VELDVPALLAAAQTPEVKVRLGRHTTEELLAREGFGVPTVLAGEELFFGVDLLGQLECFLRGEDVLFSEARERLRSLPMPPRASEKPEALRERVAEGLGVTPGASGTAQLRKRSSSSACRGLLRKRDRPKLELVVVALYWS
jgi:hypothetical protein